MPPKKNTSSFGPKHFAELVGTFALTLMVSLMLVSGLPEATALVAALTLGIFVYTIGPISGCHINPAVTFGLWSVKKIDGIDAIRYMFVQCIGAALAMVVAQYLSGTSPQLFVDDMLIVGVAEAIGAAFLVFGICSVVYGKVSDAAAGLTIGGSLLIGILVASTVSNGVINPAVALGIGSLSPLYVIGPLVGGAAGAHLYRWLVS